MAGAIAPATVPRWHQDRPGAQSPRPAPAPPPAGASRPPGRALAFRWSRTDRSTGHRRARAGKRDAFPGPARTDDSTFTSSIAKAIAFGTGIRRDQDRPGAKAPGQRPPRHRRALASASPGPAGLQGTVPRGRGKRGSRFLFPPGTAKALPPRAGTGNASRFPRPRGKVSCRSAGPGDTEASARRGWGGRWPGALAPGRS